MKIFYFILVKILFATAACSCTKSTPDPSPASSHPDRLHVAQSLNNLNFNFRGLAYDDNGGAVGLYNPDRGLRFEIHTDAKSGSDVWNPSMYPNVITLLEEEDMRYKEDSISLVQSYFYLHEFIGGDISPNAFDIMNTYFAKLRAMGKKAVLRFAYEKDMGVHAGFGPLTPDIIRHIEQLKPIVEQNKDIIHVVQAGFVGAWGEWHSSFHGIELSETNRKQIIEKILWMAPENRYVQVRQPQFKNLLPADSEEYNRTGFHDDFITVKPSEGDGNIRPGQPPFIQMVKESPYVPVDGELPWGSWSMQPPGHIVSGLGVAERLFQHHYTSFSVVHNNKETSHLPLGKYSMRYWKETFISEQFLVDNNMPFSPSYFARKDGTAVRRNVYEYIRDHVGYRIELQHFKSKSLSVTGASKFRFDLSLINRGFSAIFNEHPVYLVLIDENNVVHEIETEVQASNWMPHNPSDTKFMPLVYHITKEVDFSDLTAGTYKLGLWIPDGASSLKYNQRFAIRCANGDTQWWVSGDQKYGVNVISLIDL